MSSFASSQQKRIVSMDQFRGYTVAGMFVVNFLGGLNAVHAVFKHHNTYFSYADSIMPSFMFACGFSYRLTTLKRLANPEASTWDIYGRIFKRSLGLALVSMMALGMGEHFKYWKEVSPHSLWLFGIGLVKANLWETLGIIGVTQVLLIPLIGKSARTRYLGIVGFWLAHLLMTYAFNFNFVYGLPNVVDKLLGTQGTTAWDGGCFGLIMWGSMMLAGSLVYDMVAVSSPGKAMTKLLLTGSLMMMLAYGLSCMTMLYQGEQTADKRHLAASPVVPPFENAKGKPLAALLAEPPFVMPPPLKVRPVNYWAMNKKIVSISFTMFATGFAMALYGLFVIVCDPKERSIGLFRTLGMNPLAAYLIHEMVMHQILTLVPKDSPLYWCLGGLVVFYAITYMFVRYLERQGMYLRL